MIAGGTTATRAKVAELLEERFEQIFTNYVCELRASGSPLVTQSEANEQLRAQARLVVRDVARELSGRALPGNGAVEAGDDLSDQVGASRARANIHPTESLRAGVILFRVVLQEAVDNARPPCPPQDIAAIATTIHRTIIDRIVTAGIAYVDYLLRKLHGSHADERRRIGRELHDRVSHSIAVVGQNLELYEVLKTHDPRRAEVKMALARRITSEALDSVRELTRELRRLEASQGLERALTDCLNTCVPSDVRTSLSVTGDDSCLEPHLREELFLVIREAIRNAATHSKAKEIGVRLCTTGDQVEAIVEDDGRGFNRENTHDGGGTGIDSMRERVTILGGTLNLSTRLGQGTTAEVRVPLARK